MCFYDAANCAFYLRFNKDTANITNVRTHDLIDIVDVLGVSASW